MFRLCLVLLSLFEIAQHIEKVDAASPAPRCLLKNWKNIFRDNKVSSLVAALDTINLLEVQPTLRELYVLEKELIAIPHLVRDLEYEIPKEIREKVEKLLKVLDEDEKVKMSKEDPKEQKENVRPVNKEELPQNSVQGKNACLQGIRDALKNILDDLRIGECFNKESQTESLMQVRNLITFASEMERKIEEYKRSATDSNATEIRDHLIVRRNLRAELLNIHRTNDEESIIRCANFKKNLKLGYVKHLELTRLSCLA